MTLENVNIKTFHTHHVRKTHHSNSETPRKLVAKVERKAGQGKLS
ncbi:MAG: hypothetical protein QXD95_03580 [Nitrososphaeria archaeon]